MTITATFIDALHRLEESGNVDVTASLFADDTTLANPLVIHDRTTEQTGRVSGKTTAMPCPTLSRHS